MQVTFRALAGQFGRALGQIYEQSEGLSLYYALLADLTGWRRHQIQLRFDDPVPADLLAAIRGALPRLAQGEPLQYVTHKAYFRGMTLYVDSNVLIPRPETEELAGLILDDAASRGPVLDLGTGSGCIAVALAAARPGWRVEALDISPAAADVARRNAREQGTDVQVRRGDMLADIEPSADAAGGYGLLVSNPPYVRDSERAAMRRNVLDHEPPAALFVPDADPLRYYRAIARNAPRLLAAGGAVWLEVNEALADDTRRLFDAGFDQTAVVADFRGKPRFVRAAGLRRRAAAETNR